MTPLSFKKLGVHWWLNTTANIFLQPRQIYRNMSMKAMTFRYLINAIFNSKILPVLSDHTGLTSLKSVQNWRGENFKLKSVTTLEGHLC